MKKHTQEADAADQGNKLEELRPAAVQEDAADFPYGGT